MVETGSDALELDFMTDPVKAHDTFMGRLAFIGNHGPAGQPGKGKPGETRREA